MKFNANVVNLFADQADWLERKRSQALADLDALKARLDTVRGVAWEERPEALNSILRQAAGAYRTLERIDELTDWTNRHAA